jgi:hypothetical protein
MRTTAWIKLTVGGNEELPNNSPQAQCPDHKHQTDDPHCDIVGYTLEGTPNADRPRDIIDSLALARLSPVSQHTTRVPGLATTDNGSLVEIDPLTVVRVFTKVIDLR